MKADKSHEARREQDATPPEPTSSELWDKVSTALDLAHLLPLLGLGVPAVLIVALAEGAFAYAGVVLLLVGLLVLGVWLALSGHDAKLSPAALTVGIALAAAALYFVFRVLFSVAPH